MPKKKSTKQAAKKAEKNDIWKDPAVEVVLFETIEKLRPHNLHSHVCALNCHHALKKYLGLSVSPREILNHLREDFYEMPALDEDAKPIVHGQRDFVMPGTVSDQGDKSKKVQVGVRNRSKKKTG